MRVAFAGGRPLGVACLEHLVTQTEVAGVFVNPDDYGEHWYAGPTVLQIAQEHNIPVYSKLDADTLKALDVEILFVVYFDKLLKPEVIAVPPKGCINLHLALAEEYRGCYPTTWALINGETQTGVTLHYIDAGMDTGDIIAQGYETIVPEDTGQTLYLNLVMRGYQVFVQTLPQILAGTNPRRKQVTTDQTKVYHRQFPSFEVPFEGSAQDVYNYIRALIFPPFPGPVITIGNRKYRLEPCTN
jgi:methionyl-tRNA formyltransferase